VTATEIARGILERERDWGIYGRARIGVADSSIFDDYEPGRSVAGDMERVGVRWFPADKGSGSRAQGWQQIREYLKAAIPVRADPRAPWHVRLPGAATSSCEPSRCCPATRRTSTTWTPTPKITSATKCDTSSGGKAWRWAQRKWK
jgi:hypothetical protein